MAETVVIAMRMGLQDILEFKGYRVTPAPESTPHENAMIYSSTYEGAQQIIQFAPVDSVDTVSRQTLADGVGDSTQIDGRPHCVSHSVAEDFKCCGEGYWIAVAKKKRRSRWGQGQEQGSV